MTLDENAPLVLMICDDLMFTSKVSSATRAFGARFYSSRTMKVDSKNLTSSTCVILDLENSGLDLSAFLTRLRTESASMPQVIAYAPHVNTDSLRMAREYGCDQVLTRGQFVDNLDSLIQGAVAR